MSSSFEVGKRYLVTRPWSDSLIEVKVLEISSLGLMAYFLFEDGYSGWRWLRDFTIVEQLE